MQDPTQHDAAPGAQSGGPLNGLLQSATQMFATVVSIVQTRLELFTTELQEEIQSAAQLLVWTFIALFAAGIGLFLAALTVIFVFWDTHRMLAAIIVTTIFFVIAIVAGICLARKLRDKPRLLDATLTELARDRQRLDKRINGH